MSTLLVAGSRQFESWPHLWFEQVLDGALTALDLQPDLVIHGGAIGIDQMAAKWAMDYDLPVQSYYPDWGAFGKRAGFLRNKKMVDACTEAVVIWDGRSPGTKMTVDLLAATDKDHVVVVIHP